MKGLLEKLKAIEWKQFFVTHSEKIGFGAAVVVVLVALMMTNWSGYGRSPDEFLSQAAKANEQLMKSVWPETEREKFAAVDFQKEAETRVLADLRKRSPQFEYLVEMSPKQYPREAQLKDVVLPGVEEALVDSSRTIIETKMLAHAETAKPVTGKSAPVDKGKSKPAPASSEFDQPGAKEADPTLASPMPGVALPPGGAAGAPIEVGDASVERSGRGLRYNAVRAIVPHKKIIEAVKQALNIPYANAAALVEYKDFEIQRQTAVPGTDSWENIPWEDLSPDPTYHAIDMEWIYADAEVNDLSVVEGTFTMPLPPRMIGNWLAHGTHPKLQEFVLSKEQAEKALEEAEKLAAEVQKSGQKRRVGGFNRVQMDLSSAKRSIGTGAGGPDGVAPNMRSGPPGGRMAAPGQANPSGQMMPPGSVQGGQMMPPGQQVAGQGKAYQSTEVANLSEILLFRFFDLDPEPGRTYRYRVRVVIANPNFNANINQLEKPEVAQGEFRYTGWSEPTAPVTVEADTDYYVTKIPRRSGRAQSGVHLDVYQWNSSLGTVEKGSVKVDFGQNVGGRVRTTEGDFINRKAYENKDVLLFGQDVLVDAQGAPTVVLAELPDLTVPKENLQKLIDGQLDEALTVKPDGDILVTSAATADPSKVDSRYQDQMRAIQVILEDSKEKEDKNALEDATDPKDSKKNKNASRKKNPAVQGMMMPPGSGMMMPPGGVGMPGMSPPKATDPKKKK